MTVAGVRTVTEISASRTGPPPRALIMTLLGCLSLTACGGGGGGGGGGAAPTSTTTVSGTATKGPIANAIVEVWTLSSTGGLGTLLGSDVTASSGAFQV